MIPIRHAARQQQSLARIAVRPHRTIPHAILRQVAFSLSHSRNQSTIAQQPPTFQQPPPPQPRFRWRQIPFQILKSLFYATTFFTLGAYFGLRTLSKDSPVFSILSPPATDAESLGAYTPPDDLSAQINDHIINHPLTVALRKNSPNLREQRPHMKIPEALRATNLTGGTLAGPGKIVVPPLAFLDPEGRQMASIFYLGNNLCGHPGIIHGGLLATLLDEGLARCCFPAMPNKVAVTATLKVNYKKPVMAGGYYVLRAETTKVEGRKAWVRGWIEKLEDSDEQGRGPGGAKLVEAEALFVEPRNAGIMKRVYDID